MNDTFKVSLDDVKYEGPLAVLLEMIKRSEKNIYEISLTDIIQQFSDYLNAYTENSLEQTGDFIITASEFHLYKSKMLIPRDFINDDSTLHLHAEIVGQLLEIEKFKLATEILFHFFSYI